MALGCTNITDRQTSDRRTDDSVNVNVSSRSLIKLLSTLDYMEQFPHPAQYITSISATWRQSCPTSSVTGQPCHRRLQPATFDQPVGNAVGSESDLTRAAHRMSYKLSNPFSEDVPDFHNITQPMHMDRKYSFRFSTWWLSAIRPPASHHGNNFDQPADDSWSFHVAGYKHHYLMGFLCGWSVCMDFFAGLLARPCCWPGHIRTTFENVYVRFLLAHTAH